MRSKPVINYYLLSFVAVLVFALSDYIQWYGDSYYYRFSFDTGEPIEGFIDIFPSQYAHYFTMNGRVWAHILCQGFSALWGQTAFAVCNGIVYILFVLLFLRIAGMSWRCVSDLSVCILIILFFCDTSYNANCQIGYIWTSTVTLAFIIQYFKAKESKNNTLWKFVFLFLVSLFAGNGNEAISIGVGAALVVESAINFRCLTKPQIVMILGFGIGGLLLCLSPGIMNRASEESADVIWSAYRLIIHSRMLYVLIITLSVLKLRHRIHLMDFFRDNQFFVIAIIVLLIFNFIIGIGLSNRQLFGVELFSGILTARALRDVKIPKWIPFSSAMLVIAIYVMKFDYLRKSNEDLRNLRAELIEAEDLKLFIDFHRYNTFVHPTEVENKYRIYYFLTFAIFDDITDFGHFYLKNIGIEPPYFNVIAIYPKIMQRMIDSDNGNFAVKCDDGTYLAVRDKECPNAFFVKRNYNFLGFKWPKDTYEIEFESHSHLNIGNLEVFCGDLDTPLVENGEIVMR